jgi:hypothetical protein
MRQLGESTLYCAGPKCLRSRNDTAIRTAAGYRHLPVKVLIQTRLDTPCIGMMERAHGGILD